MMDDYQSIESLKNKIETLRNQLNTIIGGKPLEQHNDLINNELIMISKELDELIVQYMQLNKF